MLYVAKGPLKGEYITLQDGLTLGRDGADINLEDSKASSIHAKIVDTEAGWMIIDKESTNGTKVKGKNIKEILLKEKLRVQIGRTVLEVVQEKEIEIEIEEVDPKPKRPKKKVKIKKDKASQALEVAVEAVRWQDVILDFTKTYVSQIQDAPKALVALNPAVQLHFFRGHQFDTVYTMGYGPRKVGALSLQYPIFETGAPGTCFEVLPTAKGIQFKTDHPEQVVLNDQPTPSKQLEDGDIIVINETHIEIKLIE